MSKAGMQAGTLERVEIVRRERAAGRTYSAIGKELGITAMAVWHLASRYISKEERGESRAMARTVNDHATPKTQRRFRIDEWQAVMAAGSVCRYCHNASEHAAHIVEDSKRNLAKYGFYAIYHRDNLIATCARHNSKAMNEARGPVGEETHMARIIEKLYAAGIDPHEGCK